MHFDAPSRFKKGWMISIQKKTIKTINIEIKQALKIVD